VESALLSENGVVKPEICASGFPMFGIVSIFASSCPPIVSQQATQPGIALDFAGIGRAGGGHGDQFSQRP